MQSIWSKTCCMEERAALNRDIKTQTAVIGGGMAGVLTAWALSEAGVDTVVLEARTVGSGQTQNTTAKLTAQHGLIYHRLIQSFGRKRAAQYAQANLNAVDRYRALIEEKKIPCHWEPRRAYLYGSDMEALEQEAQAASSLGLPVGLESDVTIPIPAAGAVVMDGQAQFHPLEFLKGLSRTLTIYEHTPVMRVEGHHLITPGGTVEAQHVVFACHYPFVNVPGLYFAKIHQEREYFLALKGAGAVDGMWIGAGEKGYSLRNYGDLLFFGGESHRTGENSRGGRYDRLREKARVWFPGSHEVACWSAQDCITPDGVPYIGAYAPSQPNWYVATGFGKWGMTNSMVAAQLLRDRICGRDNPDAAVFEPTRWKGETLAEAAKQGGQAIKGLAKRAFQIPKETAWDIAPGHGGVVFLHGEKVGVYKDEAGELHPVDLRCPHLGCQLEWNPDECSWDCPCHGSRFDRYGHLISGPAQTNSACLEAGDG